MVFEALRGFRDQEPSENIHWDAIGDRTVIGVIFPSFLARPHLAKKRKPAKYLLLRSPPYF